MFQQEQHMQPPVLERSAPLTNDTGDDDDDYDPPMLQENVSHIDNANFNLIKNEMLTFSCQNVIFVGETVAVWYTLAIVCYKICTNFHRCTLSPSFKYNI